MPAYDNPFEALLQPEMPDDVRERARLLSKVLRRDADFGTLMQLMGTRPTADAGQSLQRGAYAGLNMAVDKQRDEARERMRSEERRQAQENWQRSFNADEAYRRATLAKQSAEEKAQWSHATDPQSGISRLYNRYTGEWKDDEGVGGGSAPSPAGLDIPIVGAANAPNAKLTETQRTGAVRMGEGTIAMRNALNAGFPDEGRISSLPDTVMQRASRAGYPQFASERVQQQSAFWQNVADPIVRARTGAAMPVEEFNNQMAMLLPRPGEAPNVQMQKAAQLIAFLKSGTVGLPPVIQQHLLQQLDVLESALPKNEMEWMQMRSSGKQQPAGIPTEETQAPTGPAPGDKYLDPEGG